MPKFELTPSEMVMLGKLITPSTSTDLFKEMNLNYPYGIKLLKRLQAKGYVSYFPSVENRSVRVYYATKLMNLDGTVGPVVSRDGSTEHRIPWNSTLMSINTALKDYVNRLKQNYMIRDVTLVHDWLWYRSYNLFLGKKKLDGPSTQDVRAYLYTQINKHQIAIELAEKLLDAPFWGEDNQNIWRFIHNSETPEEIEKKKARFDLLVKMYYNGEFMQ